MSEQENKGIIDQISDFGKKAIDKVKSGFGAFSHPDNENLAPKDTGAPKEEPLQDSDKRPGTYTGITGTKQMDEKLDSFEHSPKEHPMQETREFREEDTSNLKDYILDSYNKTRENTTERHFNPDKSPDEEIQSRENQNKDHPKVQEYGFNPELHNERKQEKLEKMREARENLERLKESTNFNPQGDTRSNTDDLYAEINKMNKTQC